MFDPYKYRSILYKDGMPDEEFSALCLRQLEETILYENPESIGDHCIQIWYFLVDYIAIFSSGDVY